MKKKKVAFIGIKALPAKAGVDVVVQKIATSFDHERFEPVVYVSNREVPADTIVPGVRIIRVPSVPGKFTHATVTYLMAALHALFFGNYDVVNVHSMETSFVLPLLRLRYKVVATAHGLGSLIPEEHNPWGKGKYFFKACEYPFMHLANIRTSVSLPDKEFLEQHYGREVMYLPIGIQLPELKFEEAREFLARHDLEPGNYMIFTAGRNIRRKGCHLVLQAMQTIDNDLPLLILGDPNFDPDYHQELLGLADDRTRFGGFIADKGLLFALIQMSSLFLFPTTYEAMAATLLEAAALKTPLIASDLPENRAVLPNEALFFESGNVADLREKMIWANDHPRDMYELATRAEALVGSRYQWSEVIDQYEMLYEALT
ncbi:MAG: glycosyltransferase family 4 protein [Anaerolineae bacterium]|uniref:glycosyltransferase family 4 protein n=1 Tax=Promineifilum sp. TaxID=2664178 RepID=UPI001E09FA54|nr:glycosyltransferase family 4 protein [Anaerolineales bacterium]MCB8935241.1 glycosyltransferase family 4 protein [Promineifilum sp.]MCO5178974.1 glycosyltransferase family 4 protein [Promineifilum sp.]MCW5846211.1 glycosyltransferase family 4 protein [Anaerolineae bacterium]